MTEKKKVLKITDLVQLKRQVDVSDTEVIEVKALTLTEMVQLFIESRDTFLSLFAAGLDGKTDAESLAPFLLSAPELVAQVIAMGMGSPENTKIIQETLAATVQLIALEAIWELSVPDPKKAQELLSKVTGLLQGLLNKEREKAQPLVSLTT